MIFKQSILISCLVALALHSLRASAAVANKRIINGIPTTVAQVPYIVQLRGVNGGQFCGGTLVSPRHVVTAAHCFKNIQPYQVVVVGGATTTFAGMGVTRKIAKLTRHPEYSPTTSHSDVAILELEQEMSGTNIKSVPLCKQALKPGDRIQVSGWGDTETGKASVQLRTAFIPVRAIDVCQREFGPFVKKNMICASGLEDKGTCFGDSGGPAIYGGQLCGIVAFGYECGKVGHTGAFTDVFALRNFIQNAMK